MGVDIDQPGLDLGDPVRIGRVLDHQQQRVALAIGFQYDFKKSLRSGRGFLQETSDFRLRTHAKLAGFGAEIAGDYKPKPVVYRAACAAFDLPPQACMMVAAHSYDLKAASACGLRTAHVARPDEAGPGTGEKHPTIKVDVAAKDFVDLARKLKT